MDDMTLFKFLFCVGILLKSSFYHVDGILFQVPENVEWSRAEYTCQKNRGKLFKPNGTLFDVSLFSKCNFKEDLWVAATYINISNFKSASMSSGRDSVIRCEMCTIGASCGTTCLYKPCGSRCSAICEIQYGPPTHVLSDTSHNWTEASQWCWKHLFTLGDKIQNVSSLFGNIYCTDGCFWTRNVIQVQFKTEIALTNEQGECGILQNAKLSFTSCDRQLHPLCEREAKTALLVQDPYFSEESNSCISMNTKVTFMPTTRASRSTNRINATIKTSSSYGISSVADSISKSTAIGLNEENTSLLVPVVATTSRNDVQNSSRKSDTGIIIGAVIGIVVFLMMTVLVIIYFRRRLLQRTGKRKSEHESKNMEMHKTNTIHAQIYSDQCQCIPLYTGPEITPFVQLERRREGSRRGIVGKTSNPGKSASMIDPEGSNFNYATVTEKVNDNSNNSTCNMNYDSYDHLSNIQESRYDNVTGNFYDTANFEQRNGCISTPDSIYSISVEHSKTVDESVGLYDRVNTTLSAEYDTTYDLKTDGNATYDHI